MNGYIYSQIVKVNGTISDTQGSLVGFTSELASINSEIANKQEKLDLLQKEKETLQSEETKTDIVNGNNSVSEPAKPEIKEEQAVQQPSKPATATPSTSSNKGGTDVDGDGIMDYDASGNLIKGSSLDKNNNGLEDKYEDDGTYSDLKGGHVPSGGEDRWNKATGGQDIDGDGKIDVDANGNIVKGGAYDKNGNGIKDWLENSDGTTNDGEVTDGSGSGSGEGDYELDTH
ncbi:hypothetical protein DCMF_13425 [Candidatus Formimonas warabiya]|uniref:Uncharacterized protein n=1 Tax=Formimonas warabiya TaxID=1761012 RepID=A0A3G1KT73_FORW1|nr:hypothetical protein DCMF_13425 [Candidatus Formimonas warabiya]